MSPARGLRKLIGFLTFSAAICAGVVLAGHRLNQVSRISAPTTGSPAKSSDSTSSSLQPDSSTRLRLEDNYGKLPMSFETNRGQTDRRVKFLSRGPGYCIFLTATEAVLALNSKSTNPGSSVSKGHITEREQAVLRIRLAGANTNSPAKGQDELPGKSNYFKGKDPRKWLTNITSYSRVEFSDVYPRVSLAYYGSQKQLEYDFIVASGGDPSRIKLSFDGAHRIAIGESGDLLLSTHGGDLVQHKPVVYQMTENGRNEIPASYVMTGRAEVGFAIGTYDKSRPLVIDPVISYATYLGGNSGAGVYSIAVDQAGNAYVTGNTSSTNFPVTSKAYRTVITSSSDVYVSKLNSTGTAFLFSSYLGGGTAYGIAVDNANNAYITGVASSPQFPTTPNAYQTASLGGGDVFVAKVNTNPSTCTPSGDVNCAQALAYSTFIGGAADEYGFGIAVDASGNAYVAGQTFSSNFPTTLGAFQSSYQGGNGDAFVTKVNPTGAALVYSTFLGGGSIHLINTGLDSATGIAVDSAGSAYVTGVTDSASFPTTPGALQPSCTNCQVFNPSSEAIHDAFITKVNPGGTGLVYSTYLGGSLQDRGSALALDASGNAYVTGQARSFDFPTTAGALQTGNGGVLKSTDSGINWNATGSGLVTSIGDTVTALAIDSTNPAKIYAGVFSFNGPSGIFKSTDGGSNWRPINNGLTATNIRALAIAPTVTPTIYAGLDVAGMYKSTDGGESWFSINTGLSETSIASLAIDPRDPQVVYAGGNNSGVHKSTDGGAHWAYTGGPGSNALCLAFDPLNPTILYAGRTNSVDRSTDGGATWEYIGQGISTPTGTTVTALVVHPASTSTIYAGTSRGVFKTIDGAATPWNAVNSGLGSLDVRALAIDRGNTSTLYAGTINGVFKSINGGNSWKPVNRGLVGSLIVSLALDPANTTTVYAGANALGSIFVTKLNDSGTALSYSTFLGSGTANSIAVDSGGSAYVTGVSPGGFPTTQDAFQPTNVADDVFLAKLGAAGTHLLFATYLGGNATDWGQDIAADSSGNVYVGGWTDSSNFPTTPNVVQGIKPGLNFQGFIAKMAFPLTANDDEYSLNPNATLMVPAPGVLANDTTIIQSPMTAVLVTDVSSGSLTLGANGSVTYTPNPNFVGYDSFEYKAQSGGSQSNIVQVVIAVASQCTISLSSPGEAIPSTGGTSSVQVTASSQCNWSAFSNVPSFLTITSVTSLTSGGTVSFSVAPSSSTTSRTGTMTIAGQTFTVIQGGTVSTATTIGLFRPSGNFFFLRNTNSLGPPDVTVGYGASGDLPIVGDWDGNGTVTIGLYRPSTSTFFLRNTNTLGPPDITVSFGDGPGGDLPIAGDWDGNGTWTIGVYRPSTSTFFIRNTNSWGVPDIIVTFGAPGDMPIVGDWDGNGTMTIGLFRPSGNFFFLRNSNTAAAPDVTVSFGAPGDLPIVGDWDGNGTTTIGLFRPAGDFFFLRNSNTLAPPDITVGGFGAPGDKPILGNWDGT